MIFVCTGTQIYQFNRLLKKIDELITDGVIKDIVYAQIGYSDYIPKYYQYSRFVSDKEFKKLQNKADLIISHGGTGALIGALKLGKLVIAVPRYKRFGEHVDDHQQQISGILAGKGYLREVLDIEQLGNVIIESLNAPIKKKYDRPSNILGIIKDYIASNEAVNNDK